MGVPRDVMQVRLLRSGFAGGEDLFGCFLQQLDEPEAMYGSN